MLDSLWHDLLATSLIELFAAALGVAYVALIARRSRLGWVAGGVSSLVYVWLSAEARLPMQAALQVYYVAMSAYGWWSWTRNAQQEAGRIASWPWPRHLAAAVGIVLVALASARWIASSFDAAWPFLDSLTTVGGLYATWLVARSVLQNWLYWIVLDMVTVFLFASQRHPVTAALYVSFLMLATAGYLRWHRQWREQGAAT